MKLLYEHLIQTVIVRIDFKTPEGREAFIKLEVTKNMLTNSSMMAGMIDERISNFLKINKPVPKLHG